MPSSVIATANYQADTKVLQITFVSGLVYDYLDVPATVYEGLKNAWSKGSYFNRVVKDRFTARRVKRAAGH